MLLACHFELLDVKCFRDREQVVLRYMLERHAEARPNQECMIFEDGETWSYAELFFGTVKVPKGGNKKVIGKR